MNDADIMLFVSAHYYRTLLLPLTTENPEDEINTVKSYNPNPATPADLLSCMLSVSPVVLHLLFFQNASTVEYHQQRSTLVPMNTTLLYNAASQGTSLSRPESSWEASPRSGGSPRWQQWREQQQQQQPVGQRGYEVDVRGAWDVDDDARGLMRGWRARDAVGESRGSKAAELPPGYRFGMVGHVIW